MTCIGDPIRTFTSNDPIDPLLVTDGEDPHYKVLWKTRDDELDAGAIYRLSVNLGSVQLGHADIDVVEKMRELAEIDSDEYVGLNDSRTLPIQFAITPALSIDPPLLGALAYYPFSGNAEDESGNGHHGTVSGATLATDRFGAAARAFDFDGSDFVETPFNPVFGPAVSYSVTAWFRTTTDQPDGMGLIGLEVTNGAEISLQTRFRQLYGYVRDDPPNRVTLQLLSTTTVDDGEWHFGAVVRDAQADEVRLYLDGQLVASVADDTNNPFNAAIAQTMALGAVDNSTFNMVKRFTGTLDELTVYGRALEPSEIAWLCDLEAACN